MSTYSAIGVIGGSGFYHLKPDSTSEQSAFIDLHTPFDEEPVRLTQDELNGTEVYFLQRHGSEHKLPPHRINYRANLWALKEVGVKKIIAVNAVGGISANLTPSTLVIPDQLIDYTWGRDQSFFDGLNSLQDHIEFTYPYSSELRDILLNEAINQNLPIIKQACFACTQGPRLETAAEIQKIKGDGCDIVGMTGMPEASLARELGLAYACIALVVNPAAGLSDEVITIDKIKTILDSGLQDVRLLLSASLGKL
ncbi:MAG: S-methyl-5'-thioinosine phosphorylase [Gammaproteobacteria bacterium]|jgi:5'-methylthioinosine phosphorylase|nr:S-methyl-5'-thioinosine phosphorylase [Gammaproteobacteria bacterium]